jgi:hypothetical protein
MTKLETSPKARKPRMYKKLIDVGPRLADSITARKILQGYSWETESFREILQAGLQAMREQQEVDPNAAPSALLKKRYVNTSNRRLLSLPEPLASELRAYRAERKISNTSAAVRQLVEAGLEALNARNQPQQP